MAGKSGITSALIRRQWPHRVELPAVPGPENTAATWGLGAAPCPLSDFHDDRHFTIFHFKTAEAAQAFHARFGDEIPPPVEPRRRRKGRQSTPASVVRYGAYLQQPEGSMRRSERFAKKASTALPICLMIFSPYGGSRGYRRSRRETPGKSRPCALPSRCCF